MSFYANPYTPALRPFVKPLSPLASQAFAQASSEFGAGVLMQAPVFIGPGIRLLSAVLPQPPPTPPP